MAISSVGEFIIAFALNIPVLITQPTMTLLGSGAIVTFQSFIASKVDSKLSGRLFSGISTVETIGGCSLWLLHMIGAYIMRHHGLWDCLFWFLRFVMLSLV